MAGEFLACGPVFGVFELELGFCIVAICCTNGWDVHLRYAVPAQSGCTKVVRTGLLVSSALHLAHLMAFSMSFA